MLKKIVLGTLFVGLVAVLVIGAANRTSARAESDSEVDHSVVTTEASKGQEDGGRGLGDGDQGLGDGDQGLGVGGQGDGRGRDEAGLAQTGAVTGWVAVDGTVTDVNGEEIIVETADGQTVSVGGRSWSYAQEQQFGVQVGDRLRLHGFYEGEELEVGRIENQRSGASVQMRDENGRPMWAGRGWRAAE